MPGIRAVASALAAAACAVAIAACGGGDERGPIPPDQGNQLLAQLDQIENAIQAGECDTAQEAALAFAQDISSLPNDVTGELRERLVEASANLAALTQDPEQCTDTGATGENGTVPTTETTTTTTDTTTTPPEEPEDDDRGGGRPDDRPPGDDDDDDDDNGDDSGGGIGSGD